MAATGFLALFIVLQNTTVLCLGAQLLKVCLPQAPESTAALVIALVSGFGHPSVEQQVRCG